ncbi:hypothetical protein [Sphingomonas sp.]|uniref:hypothetical protein n=1 Tax=Sphingomonas sp. TaxID=28214 RepID=UPI002DD648DE|nr:hypothetical protein [Sphingomonas sp.]
MRLPPVALGALAGFALAAAATPFAAGALGDLKAARIDRATLAQVAAAPAPARDVVITDQAIAAPDAGAAADALAARLRALAGQAGLTVEEAVPQPSLALARARLRFTGSEVAVIAFADAVERGVPVIRFARWSAEARGGQVVLAGEAVAPWR